MALFNRPNNLTENGHARAHKAGRQKKAGPLGTRVKAQKTVPGGDEQRKTNEQLTYRPGLLGHKARKTSSTRSTQLCVRQITF
jgi:hypothetical protein